VVFGVWEGGLRGKGRRLGGREEGWEGGKGGELFLVDGVGFDGF